MAKTQTQTKSAKSSAKVAPKAAPALVTAETIKAASAATVAPAAPTVAPVAPAVAKVACPAVGSPFFYAALLVSALEGFFGDSIKGFYANAATYHRVNKHDVTWFINRRAAGIAKVGETLLTHEDAIDQLERHRATGIPNGNTWSRRLYEEMRIEAHAKATAAKA